jgi:hypothetical protein
MTNPDTQFSSITFVNGDFDKASMKVFTTYKSGSGLYGCILVYTIKTTAGNSYRTYSFLISPSQQYAIGKPTSENIMVSTQKSYIHGSTGDAKDTLEIIRFNHHYRFKINGTFTDDSLTIPDNKAPDGAGVSVGPSTSVSFDMFTVGGDSSGASCPVIMTFKKPHNHFIPLLPTFSSERAAYNVLGRIIKRFDGNYNQALRNGAAGIYFLKPNGYGVNSMIKVTTP